MPKNGNIKTLRKRLNESQAAFASRLGVNQSTINRWEKRGLPERGIVRAAVERMLEDIEAEVAQ